MFCTNAFGKRERKAANLSEALGIKVDPDQIIMSQSPLEMFHEYHDKTVLVVGPEHDGGFFDVAQELGFENIVTLGKRLKFSPPDGPWSGPDEVLRPGTDGKEDLSQSRIK